MRFRVSLIYCLMTISLLFLSLPQRAEASITVDIRVSSAGDDAEQIEGVVELTDSDLDLQTGVIVGLRFQGVQVPQGATIVNAYIEFTPEDGESGTFTVDIAGQDSDDAPAFQEVNHNLSSRTLTSAAVTWSDDTTWNDSHTEQHQTSNLSTIVKEIVDRPGWSGGN